MASPPPSEEEEVVRRDLSPVVVREDNRGKRPASTTKTIQEVVSMVKTGEVKNPMFQRIEAWTMFKEEEEDITKKTKKTKKQPKKTKQSNYYEFIEFLYETCHSFGSFTWAKYTDGLNNGYSYSDYYLNIDGNNRMCAIVNFFLHPLRLFSQPCLKTTTDSAAAIGAAAATEDDEDEDDDDEDDDEEEDEEDKKKTEEPEYYYHNFGRFRENPEKFKDIIEFLESLALNEIMHFNMKRFKARYVALYKSLTEDEQNYLEEEMERTKDNLQTRDRSGNPSNFYDEVVISINVLENPNKEYLADIYQKINGKHNPMSASDIAMAMLYTANKFVLSEAFDPVFETQLRVKLDDFYNNRFKDACVVRLIDAAIEGGQRRVLNGYEFLVALQEHCHDRFHLVTKFDDMKKKTTGYGFMLKLFDFMYGLLPDSFTTTTVRTFATTVMDALVVLHAVYDDVFPSTMKFERARKTYSKTDALFQLCVIISKFNEMVAAGTMEAKKRNLIVRKVMVYHFCVNRKMGVLSKENLAMYKVTDELQYLTGGDTVKNKARTSLKYPLKFGENITEKHMESLFHLLVTTHNEKAAASAAAGKREGLPDEILLILSIYYHSRVPFHTCNKEKRNNDHIFPASCSEAESVTLSRVGNYMIISEALNKGRQNRSIQYYYDKDPALMRCLDYPSIEEYDRVVEYPSSRAAGGGGKPVLRNVQEFDRLAENLETKYVDLAIKYVFDIV